MKITCAELGRALAQTVRHDTLLDFKNSEDNRSYSEISFWATVLSTIRPKMVKTVTLATYRKRLYQMFRDNYKTIESEFIAARSEFRDISNSGASDTIEITSSKEFNVTDDPPAIIKIQKDAVTAETDDFNNNSNANNNFYCGFEIERGSSHEDDSEPEVSKRTARETTAKASTMASDDDNNNFDGGFEIERGSSHEDDCEPKVSEQTATVSTAKASAMASDDNNNNFDCDNLIDMALTPQNEKIFSRKLYNPYLGEVMVPKSFWQNYWSGERCLNAGWTDDFNDFIGIALPACVLSVKDNKCYN